MFIYLFKKKNLNKFTLIVTDNKIRNRSGLNEEITLRPSYLPFHPSFLCLF